MVHVHDQLKDQASRPRLFGGVDCRDSFHRLCVLDDQGRVLVAATDGHDVAGPELLSDQLACLANAFPNAVMIHTPVHASWLNQAEIFFSITQKKVISPNDFASLDELAGTLLAFVDRYNQTARPFNWKFTAADLARLLDRISAREHAAPKPAELPKAA